MAIDVWIKLETRRRTQLHTSVYIAQHNLQKYLGWAVTQREERLSKMYKTTFLGLINPAASIARYHVQLPDNALWWIWFVEN